MGTIWLVAGTPGVAGFSGDGGPATLAKLSSPAVSAVDAGGNVYIADGSNNRVRLVNGSTGIISTVAGAGTAGFNGDGKPATSTQLNQPWDVSFDAAGLLLVVDCNNNRVRRVSAAGVVSTVAGTGVGGYNGDGIAATSAALNFPYQARVGPGNVTYIVEGSGNRLRAVSANGTITTVAGTGAAGFSGDGGPASLAQLNAPRSVVVGPDGSVTVGDFNNARVRTVSTGGNISTVAGSGAATFSGDGGPATSAGVREPYGLAYDAAQALYVVDMVACRVRRVAFPPAPSASGTPNATATSSGTATPNATATTTPSGTALWTPSDTAAATLNATNATNATAAVTPSGTAAWTPTRSGTAAASQNATAATANATRTAGAAATTTPSKTPTRTPSATTATPSRTATPNATSFCADSHCTACSRGLCTACTAGYASDGVACYSTSALANSATAVATGVVVGAVIGGVIVIAVVVVVLVLVMRAAVGPRRGTVITAGPGGGGAGGFQPVGPTLGPAPGARGPPGAAFQVANPMKVGA